MDDAFGACQPEAWNFGGRSRAWLWERSGQGGGGQRGAGVGDGRDERGFGRRHTFDVGEAELTKCRATRSTMAVHMPQIGQWLF